jgi:hypothetical protein
MEIVGWFFTIYILIAFIIIIGAAIWVRETDLKEIFLATIILVPAWPLFVFAEIKKYLERRKKIRRFIVTEQEIVAILNTQTWNEKESAQIPKYAEALSLRLVQAPVKKPLVSNQIINSFKDWLKERSD